MINQGFSKRSGYKKADFGNPDQFTFSTLNKELLPWSTLFSLAIEVKLRLCLTVILRLGRNAVSAVNTYCGNPFIR